MTRTLWSQCTFCKNTTDKAYLCIAHLEKIYGLVQKDSLIPGAGQGLFATRLIEAGDIAAPPYTGRVVTTDQLESMYGGSAPFAIWIGNGYFIDSAIERSWPACINHSATLPNVAFVLEIDNPSDPLVSVLALKDVQPGEELLVNYFGY